MDQPCIRPSSLCRHAFILAVGFIRDGVVGSAEGRSESRVCRASRPFLMIYVNKVENLAGGPTRGSPRRRGSNRRHRLTTPVSGPPTPSMLSPRRYAYTCQSRSYGSWPEILLLFRWSCLLEWFCSSSPSKDSISLLFRRIYNSLIL